MLAMKIRCVAFYLVTRHTFFMYEYTKRWPVVTNESSENKMDSIV
jgi:hypothetical protein